MIAPLWCTFFACEKEERAHIESNEATLVYVEQINLNESESEFQSDERASDLAYDKISCMLEGDPQNKPSGTKCSSGTLNDCHTQATTRCKSSTAFYQKVELYLTPLEADMFWRKTYNKQFVLDKWDFFMAGYELRELNHPDEIIRNL